MNFNKNNPRFRKPRLTGRRRKEGFFTKLGSRADSIWRKLKGGPPADQDGENRPHRPHPPVPPDFLEDLKIAMPKPRTKPCPCPPPSTEAGKEGAKAQAAADQPKYRLPDKTPAPTKSSQPEAKPAPPAADDLKIENDPPSGSAAQSGNEDGKGKAASVDVSAGLDAVNDKPSAKPAARPLKKLPPSPVDQAAPPPPKRPRPAPPARAATREKIAEPSADKESPIVAAPAADGEPKAEPKTPDPAPIAGPRDAGPASSSPLEVFGPFKSGSDRRRSAPDSHARPRRYRWATMAVALVVVVTGLVFFVSYFSQKGAPRAKVARIPATNLPKVAPLTPGFYELLAREYEAAVGGEVTIAQGSTLGKAMEALGVGMGNRGRAVIACLTGEGGVDVVRPGATIKAFWSDRGKNELKRLEYYPSSGGAPYVVMPRTDGSYWRYSLASQPMTVTGASEGVVNSSLWEAGSKAGLDANIIMSLADVMASEIDFLSDIKKGDTFQVLYQREYRDGRAQGSPVIEMVRMTNKGKEYEYYYYVDSNGKGGYYDVNFRSSQKTFFVSPLQYKRISSGFTMKRLHPIHKVVRPHQGVDYAAPSGTPISTVADGTVIFCGWSGGYGRLVTIQHDATYTTMYAHMSKFAAGIKKGVTVKQGDLIGYVGASGTATGPHLDFRLKKNGVFIDPVPELAKQQGKALGEDDKQKFTRVLTSARNRMTHYLAKNAQATAQAAGDQAE